MKNVVIALVLLVCTLQFMALTPASAQMARDQHKRVVVRRTVVVHRTVRHHRVYHHRVHRHRHGSGLHITL